VKGAFMEAKPAFAIKEDETLWVKNLWIGRTYNSPAVQMDWTIKEGTPLRTVTWWVNREPESVTPSATDIQGGGRGKNTDSCRFTLTESGTWYFHLIATDTNGKSNFPTSFPLSVAFNQHADLLTGALATTEQATWQQPDGRFQIPLGEKAQLIAVKTLRLVIGDHEYSLPMASIDYNTGMLNVSAESFQETAPLGIDGESLAASLSGADLNGRPMDNIAQLTLRIKSPFEEEVLQEGVRIQAKRKNKDDPPWFVYWRSPHAPWMARFPGSVSNSLIFFQGANSLKEKNPTRWERPISIVASTEQREFWCESMEAPTGVLLPATPGNLPMVAYRGGEVRNSTLNAEWVQQISPETPFEAGYVRVAIATRGSGLRLIRTTISDAMRLLSRQSDKQTMRLDGWVPPTGAPVLLQLPKEASLDYAIDGMSSFARLATDTLIMEPNGDWQRFSVLIRAPNKSVTRQVIRITGTPYW
jgi:hypothetical protein